LYDKKSKRLWVFGGYFVVIVVIEWQKFQDFQIRGTSGE